MFIDSVNQLHIIKKMKKGFKKKTQERYQDLSEKEKNKKDNIVESDIKIYLKMKNIS